MKKKVSISMEEATLKRVEHALVNTIFRSKSHLIEYATEKFLKEAKNGRD